MKLQNFSCSKLCSNNLSIQETWILDVKLCSQLALYTGIGFSKYSSSSMQEMWGILAGYVCSSLALQPDCIHPANKIMSLICVYVVK